MDALYSLSLFVLMGVIVGAYLLLRDGFRRRRHYRHLHEIRVRGMRARSGQTREAAY